MEHLLATFDVAAPDAWKQIEISEPTIPTSPFKLGELRKPAGFSEERSELLDLGSSEQVCTAPTRQQTQKPRMSTIMTLTELKQWSDAGRKMPEFDPLTERSSNAAGIPYERSADGHRQPVRLAIQ